MSLQKVPDLMLHHLAKSTMLSLQKNKGSGKLGLICSLPLEDI